MRNRLKQYCLSAAMVAAATIVVHASGAEAQESWPDEPITFMVSTPSGGSIDRLSRTLAPFLSEELGQPVVVENVPGGHGILSHDRLLRNEPDGSLILSSTIAQLIDHVNSGRVDFGLDDFIYLNSPSDEWAVLVVTADTPYQTAEELIDAIRANPGELSAIGAPGTGPGMLQEMMFDRLEIADDDVRSVVFQGGGPIMNALMGGQVDFGVVPSFLATELDESVRVVAIFRDEPSDVFEEVPTINEVLANYDTSMPPMNTGIRAIVVPAAIEEAYPEHLEILVAAMERVYQREDALAQFEEMRTGTIWLGPEGTRAQIDDFQENWADYLGSE